MFNLCLFTKVLLKSLFISRFSKFIVLQIAKKKLSNSVTIYDNILKSNINIRKV